jgi:hypothetical protein
MTAAAAHQLKTDSNAWPGSGGASVSEKGRIASGGYSVGREVKMGWPVQKLSA